MSTAADQKKKWEALQARLSEKMLETQSKPTPFPDKLTTLKQWRSLDWTCVGDKRLLLKSLADVPRQEDFVRDNETPYATNLFTFIRWRIKCAEDSAKKKKRKAEREAEKALKRLRNERPYDKLLFPNREARRAAMKKAIWNDFKKEVTMGRDDFLERGGSGNFWKELKEDERAAKVLAAKVAEALRQSTRVRRATKHYDPAAAAEQAGAPPHDGNYPHLGVEEDETVCRIVMEDGGVEALKALGVDWVCGAWQSETALEMKLRGLMEQLSRILTIGAVTTKVHCDQALAALERELDKRLAAWYATLPKARVAPLGEATNHGDASSAPAACVGAAAADGADVRGGAPSRDAVQTACGGAASALGDAAETPSMEVRLDAARRRGLDLARLVLDANKAVLAGAQRFAGDASDASTAARSADRLTRVARAASADLKNKHAICDALDDLPLGATQFGLLGLSLLRSGFVAFDPTTGKVVVGEPIRRMRERVAGLAAGEKGKGTKFHLHHVVLVSVQLAFANTLLDFKRMRLSLFQCVQGRYVVALWAWLNGLTATDFIKMGLPLNMIVVEFKEDEVKLLPPAVAKDFPGGIKFAAPAVLLAVHQNANKAFAALKNGMFREAMDAYNNGAADIVSTLLAVGADASGSAAARGSVAMDVDDAKPLSTGALRAFALAADAAAAGFAVPQGDGGDGGHARKLLASFCAGALESPEDGTALARVDAALAAGGSSGLAAATRIAAGVASRVDLDLFLAVVIYAPPPREMTFRCDMRSHTNTVDGWLDWRRIDEFYAVYKALRVHKDWGCEPAWIESSQTYRGFEASGEQILAGIHLSEMTRAVSVCTVFDSEDCEGGKYGTYTIFIGSDYQFAARGRAPVDKCACIFEAVKAYMASRAAA